MRNFSVRGVHPSYDLPAIDIRHKKFLETLLNDLVMAGEMSEIDIVHCHTWYSHFAGLLTKQLLQVPLVLTTHSLEPHRPWKVEQLGSAYYASTWIERTAYQNADGVVAVSESMKQDVHKLYRVAFEKIAVIHNGIDLEQYRPTFNPQVLGKYDIDPNQPFILFVGRITRQKGIIHLVNAIRHCIPGFQVVLCAGAPDTEDIGLEMEQKVEQATQQSANKIIWIPEMLPKQEVIVLYSHAALFVCPSVYEPFGIINLEAMACETPVVASAVGGIPEVVVPDETGLLVPIAAKSKTDVEPVDPEAFSRDLASAINALLSSSGDLRRMGRNSRKRVEQHFSWQSIAKKTLAFYQQLLEKRETERGV
jgi:starch synthase